MVFVASLTDIARLKHIELITQEDPTLKHWSFTLYVKYCHVYHVFRIILKL